MKLVLDDGTEVPLEDLKCVGDVNSKTAIIAHIPVGDLPYHKANEYMFRTADVLKEFFSRVVGKSVRVLALPIRNGEKVELQKIQKGYF